MKNKVKVRINKRSISFYISCAKYTSENLEENWIQRCLKTISNILSLRILDRTDGRNTKYNLSKTENQEPSLYPRNLEYCGH